MIDTDAEDITETADDNQDDQTTDDAPASEDVTSSANETVLADDKAADQDADDAEDTDGDDADSDGEAEPVSYDSLTIPDGMEVDEAMMGEFKDLAAKMNDSKGLSPEDAQLLVDFRAKTVSDSLGEWETKFSEWRGELLSDKEIGGDNFKTETVPNVMAAVERFGGPEAVTLFQTNKLYGENPVLVRMLNRVGETLRADQHARGRAAGPNDEESRLRRLYPTHYNEDGTLKEGHKGAPV
jgi:hypothetical protein